ncbi:MAG: hypothetical protein KA297_25250 [Kofleriaceae bacterium]|jgi:hypothetical protein|nr:hypothetical protein [Kofleriaceae bacterium]
MTTLTSGWTVLDEAAGVLTCSYRFGKGKASSATFVARMGNGQLLVVSPAKGLPEATFTELARFGPVGALVANNGFHHLGQAEWRARFPAARCFAPAAAIARIHKKNPGAGAFEPLAALADLTGPDVGFREVPDSKAGESWFWARVAGGHAWYPSDVLANMPTLPPFPVSLLFKWTGSAPGFRVFGLALKMLVRDKPATLRLLRDDLDAHPPTIIVPAHGDVLTRPGLAAEARALLDAAL